MQAGDFDVATELAALEALGGGGVASFTGVVRGGGGLVALELEQYPAMTQAQVARIVDDAMARWPLLGVSVIHRYGRLEPGARIVFVLHCVSRTRISRRLTIRRASFRSRSVAVIARPERFARE